MRQKLTLIYGGAAYLLFLGAFLYAIGFVGNLLVPKSIDSGIAGATGQAIIVNLLLLGLFGLQHSGMARPAFKRWWTKIIPKSIERSTYVLFASLTLVLLFWQWRPLPAVLWDVQIQWLRVLLWALFGLGWGIVLAATFMISHTHLFGLKQVYDHAQGKEQAGPKFQTPGLYRYLRHPLMLGFFIAFWSTPRMTVGHLLFSAVTTGYILIAVQLEERDLMHRFGERYRRYRQQVPMFFPRIRRNQTQSDPREPAV
ncbi:MAG: methanethiol S-methyltransferase [Anaerolineales bacterium]